MARRGRSSSGPERRGRGGAGGGRGGPAPGGARSDRGASAPVDLLWGRNPVREALRGRRAVRRVWAVRGAAEAEWLRGVDVEAEDAEALTARCGSAEHQGVVAEVDPYPYAEARALLGVAEPLIVALDEVQDPHNLGAVCRSAEVAGATGVVVPERRSATVTGAVAKASAGAVEHLPVARVRNLADFLADAKALGCWVYGAAAGAPTAYDEPDFRGGVVLVLGAEGRGLRPRVASACDALLSLPVRGRVESLNVSATAAVLLYEILQQRAAFDSAP